ncbi:hypothetical protein TNCV_2414611 [Trichonephila clavipes]|nr:hypothetical protein TNCV_2414611 [Trichonephila clavipes]
MPNRKSKLSKNIRKVKSRKLQRENGSQNDRESHPTNCRKRRTLLQIVIAFRLPEINFYRDRSLVSAKQTTSVLRDIESKENSRQRLNDQIRTNISWREKYNSGFNYDSQINYSVESETCLMNVGLQVESKGMCGSSGKVRLDSIQQPLKSSLCGEKDPSKGYETL